MEDLVATIFAIDDKVKRFSPEWFKNTFKSLISWKDIENKPKTFPPSLHTHSEYLKKELDPVFAESPAGGITQTDIDNWNDAVTDEELQEVADDLATLAARTTTVSGDATGSGVTDIPITVVGVHGHDVPTPTAGFLRWNGTAWVFVEGDLPETAGLNDLSDVTLTSPISHDTLEFHSGEWVNRPSFYEHIQLAPSTSWVVTHNLGRPPVGVSIFDTSGRAVGCRIEHETTLWNQFTVRPGNAVGGRVTWK